MQTLLTHWRWLPTIVIAVVFLQSLAFKFTGSPETTYIFGTLGDFFNFPWFAKYGPYLTGGAELVASIILVTRFWAWGAVLAFEIMSVAILFHLFTPLGIAMPVFEGDKAIGSDGGTLFIMACVTLACAASLITKDWISKESQIRHMMTILFSRKNSSEPR